MSVAIRTKRLSESFVPPSATESVPTILPTQTEAEALEQAVQPREAPESRFGCHAEGTESRHGRAYFVEHEFTHGRSQS